MASGWTIHFDVESASTVSVGDVGAAAYWAHVDTRVICVSHAENDGPVKRWLPGMPPPAWCSAALLAAAGRLGAVRIVAHNYLFEYHAWGEKLCDFGWGSPPPLSVWDCTMARALYWGLPAALGDACDALQLAHRKDRSARALVMRMSRSREHNSATGATTWWHETDPAKLADLQAYCDKDVEAERALDNALPPMSAFERDVFVADGRINTRGMRVDRDLITALDRLSQEELSRLNSEMSCLTDGRATTVNQVKVILDELRANACPLPDLTRATVSDAIKAGTGNPVARTILRVRQEAAKSSLAKLKSMSRFAAYDGRCRGMFQYGGAGRTLRWAGRGPQPQNIPRGVVKNVTEMLTPLARAVNKGGATAADVALLTPGSVMDFAASALRGCFIPASGCAFLCADASQIEARVIAWLAGQQDVLDVFARGEDVYSYTAARLGSTDRMLGKVLVLACGFGMGFARFQATAATYGVNLTTTEASEAVRRWRALNRCIVALWGALGSAAYRIIPSPHGTEEVVSCLGLVVRKSKRAMQIVLPSGRMLTYHNAELQAQTDSEVSLAEITFMGVDPKTKQWSRQRTYGGKLAENVTQAVARDVLANAVLKLEAAGYQVVGTAHDEILVEVLDTGEQKNRHALDRVLGIMRTPPSWAAGLPLAAEGWTGNRYRK